MKSPNPSGSRFKSISKSHSLTKFHTNLLQTLSNNLILSFSKLNLSPSDSIHLCHSDFHSEQQWRSWVVGHHFYLPFHYRSLASPQKSFTSTIVTSVSKFPKTFRSTILIPKVFRSTIKLSNQGSISPEIGVKSVYQWKEEVLVTKNARKIKVYLATDLLEPVTLHWGFSKTNHGKWLSEAERDNRYITKSSHRKTPTSVVRCRREVGLVRSSSDTLQQSKGLKHAPFSFHPLM